MATTNGGWSLSGTTLQYREKDGDGNLTNKVLASISGLTIQMGTADHDGQIMVQANGSWRKFENSDVTIEDSKNTETNKIEGTITIASAILPKATNNKTISVTSSTGYDYVLGLKATDQVQIDKKDDATSEVLKHGTAGTTTINADLTAGFTMAANKKSATYYTARTNQVLATITGLARNYTESTLAFSADADKIGTDKVGGAGSVTLSKTSTAGEVSALGTGPINLSMSALATANGLSYSLKLNEGDGTYAQVAKNDEAAYWTASGTKATYQYYSPTGYQLTNAAGTVIEKDAADDVKATATKVKVTAAKTTTVVTVTGLLNGITTNQTDATIAAAKTNPIENSVATEVGVGQARITNNFTKGLAITSGKDVTADGGKPNGSTKGEVEIDISKAVLPTSGSVTVTPGTNFNVKVNTASDFHTDSEVTSDGVDTAYDDSNTVKNKRIWVINGNTATYKEVDLAYYTTTTTTTNGKTTTTIKCTPQTGGTTLATIRGLNADWLEKYVLRGDAKDTNGVITEIKGITVDTKADGYTYENGKIKKADTTKPGTITLSSEVLAGANVTIANSDNYRLVLATEDGDDTTKVALPKFSDYKWNLTGTTATLKGTIAAGYTVADNGKTITYTAGGDNKTLATVSGLKRNTILEKSDVDENNKDVRTIGNYIDGTFTDGLVASTEALSHNADTGYLTRLPITISKHVMDTSQIGLNSSFFTLAINKKDVDGATTPADLTAKAASRTYVLDKDEIYNSTENANGTKTYTTAKDGADAIIGWHGSLGATATLKKSTPACYELVTDAYGTTKTIRYTAPKSPTTLATIRGLNSAITENDIEVGTTAESDDGKIKITIKNANALTTGNVTITNATATTANPNPPQYKLALATGQDGKVLSGLGEATLTDKTWSQSGTTVTYKATVTGAGYKLNADQNTITYTKNATTPTTLATITGLRPEIAKITTGDKLGQFAGVAFDENTGTITLSKSALNNTRVALSGSANYKLQVASDVEKKAEESDRWVISGTTAIYKRVTPGYYTYKKATNSIDYTVPADVKYAADYEIASLRNKAMVFGTIRGLKSNLAVSEDGKKIGYYDDSGTFKEAIEFGTETTEGEKTVKPITITDAAVLDYKSSVTLDATAIASGYTIALSDDLVNTVKPALTKVDNGSGTMGDKTPEWTVSRGTATYKGDIEAGYTNNSNGTSIDFSAKKTGATIATITGLDTTLTNDDVTDETKGLKLDNGAFTVHKDLLGTSNVKLTTNIKLTGSDYKLALDSGVPKASDVESGKKDIWSISGTTATYGTYKDAYYSLNTKILGENNTEVDGPSDTITYHKEGVADEDRKAIITGLASGLVTITETVDGKEVDAIRGITVGADNVITLDSNVLPASPTAPTATGNNGTVIKLENKGDPTYTLGITSNVDQPADAISYSITNNTYTADVNVQKVKTAGYTLNNDNTTLTYTAANHIPDGVSVEIDGLKKGITVNATTGKIDGIEIDETNKIITLSKSVLTDKDVTIPSNSDYGLALATGDDAPTSSARGNGWKATSTKGTYEFRMNMLTSGYTLDSGDKPKKITYNSGGGASSEGTLVAMISGLNNATLTGTELSGVKYDSDNKQIIISKSALAGKDVTMTIADGQSANAPTLALNKETTKDTTVDPEVEVKDEGYVDASTTERVWSINNGTATFKETISEGYEVVTEEGKPSYIKYTPKGTVTSTLTNLSKETFKGNAEDEETDPTTGENKKAYVLYTSQVSGKHYGIEFKEGVFTVTDPNALAHKNVKLTTTVSGTGLKATDFPYTLELGTDKDNNSIAAETENPVWNKTEKETKATYTQETKSGYTLSGDKKNITYSSDPTVATLATITGLKAADVAASGGTITGLTADSTAGTIKVSKGVLTNTAVNLTSDKYKLTLDTDADTAVPTSTTAGTGKVWAVSGTTATYKNVDMPYYTLDSTGKKITYTAQKDASSGTVKITEIKGLKSGLKPNADGKIEGITPNDEETVKTVTLSNAVLGTTDITSDTYTLDLASDVTKNSGTWKAQKEWVGNGTTYTYKNYDKAYYTVDTNGAKKITYTKAKDNETYATITGLAKDLIASGSTAVAAADAIGFVGESGKETTDGTITLGAIQLKGVTGNVTLKTNGNFKLVLNTDTAENAGGVQKAEISETAWKTSGTTATLSGTKSIGYTLSEDAKTVTYQKAPATVTVAKVSGLKKDAVIVDDTTADNNNVVHNQEGTSVITLKRAQLGTTNVTVTGDGYTLAVDDDAKSGTKDPAWVKANNATTATFTQATENGFTASADGKTLTYWKNKSNSVTLLTLSGLSKDITTDNMAVVENDADVAGKFAEEGKNYLVVLSKQSNQITVKKEALSGKVTVGNKDPYTLKLYGATNGAVGGESVTDKINFNKANGTMTIVTGTTDKWQETTDGKSLTYTVASYKTKATVTGLPKTLTYTDSGTSAELAGVTVDDGKITIGKDAVFDSTNNVSLLNNNAAITLTNNATNDGNYALELGTGLDTVPTSPDKKKWVLSGTTAALKAVTSAGYTLANNKITYKAEAVGSNLASVAFTGLPKDFIKQDAASGNIYLASDSTKTAVITNTLTDMTAKTISLGLLDAIKTENLATTITLTSNDYIFDNTNFTDGAKPQTKEPKFNEDSFKTSTKATLQKQTEAGWTLDTSKKKAVFSKESWVVAGTVNGLNRDFNYTKYNTAEGNAACSLNTTDHNITIGASALTTTNVTFTKAANGDPYTFILANDVASTMDNHDTSYKNQTEWVSSNGTATYKFYDKDNWYVDSAKNQITYVKPTNGTKFAAITGMTKTASISPSATGVISLGSAELGTAKVTLSITKANNPTDNASITAGNNTAANFKLALKSDVTLSENKDAVWDSNGTVANLTGTITKGYKLSNDQMSITYNNADKPLQVIAKVSGLKKDSQITDDNVTLNSSNENLTINEITLDNSHLGTSNVVLTGEGYKLKLADAVLTSSNSISGAAGNYKDQTEWVNNNGTFVYKTYDKAHYDLNATGMQVIYTAAKDDKTNPTKHQTYAQITGLLGTADATLLSAATSVSGSANVTADDGVIKLKDGVLRNTTIKLTDSQNGGYTLSLADVSPSLKSAVDANSVKATVSGTGANVAATWTGTQGKGYFLSNDLQNVTYNTAAKTNQTIAKVTGLNSTVTSANTDAFSSKYNASNNTVTLGEADVGEKVALSGTAAFAFENSSAGHNVTGSNFADSISFSSGSNSINAGGGNDYVQLGGSGNNTIFYASGNGNDVIKGFVSGSDEIKITNLAYTVNTNGVKNIEVYQDTKIEADAIVKVNSNYIRLKGMGNNINGDSLKIYDKNNYKWNGSAFVAESSNVLADDNYAMTPQNASADEDYAMSPNLSSIVKNSTASYTADDLVADDATALTKQSTAVSYSDKK